MKRKFLLIISVLGMLLMAAVAGCAIYFRGQAEYWENYSRTLPAREAKRRKIEEREQETPPIEQTKNEVTEDEKEQ